MQASDEELRGRAGRSVRDLGHALVGHHAPPELLGRISHLLDALTAELQRGEPRSRPGADFQNRMSEPEPPDGAVFTTYPDRPISGAASPWGVDLVVHREDDWVVGRCVLRSAHEGAPQRSHGGVVAAIFDDVMGFVLHLHQRFAFTGDLYVRYEAPTPLFVPVEFRARLAEEKGRKMFIEAAGRHGEVQFASARGTFITVPGYA